MDIILTYLSPSALIFALVVGVFAGFVKGIVGFALPTVMISGLSAVLAPELALAAIILPTLLSNGIQALRQGIIAAIVSAKKYGMFLAVAGVFLLASAQLVSILPQRVMLLLLGVPITFYALTQLLGWEARLSGKSRLMEASVGAFAGFIGGISGVWGPPTVAYLTAVGTPKADQMRVQGVIYGLGSVLLLLAHIQSGVMRAETAPLSFLMILPAMVGLFLGMRLQDRIDQKSFRRLTLFVLLIAGMNLVRRGLF